MDPRRALCLEITGHRDRIRVVDGLGVEVAAEEPHGISSTQVDRGVEVYNDPLVLGSAEPSILTASRRHRATPLNDASITW